MPLGLHPLEQIINVHWEEGELAFLYSGADGMFGSQTGETWTKAESSIPAVSLAWVDDVWVGCGPDGCWRSDDGAKTWTNITAPAFREVVAMKPEGVGPDDKPKQGIFAGWLMDEGEDNHIVYTSHDLGKTWSVVFVIPVDGGTEDGNENVMGLSGCGNGLFVCTIRQSGRYHQGDGKIYSSVDGNSFSGETVFGPGTITVPENPNQFPRKGYTASAVGYDAKNKTYIAVGEKGIVPALGQQVSHLIYTTSSTISFGTGEGTIEETGSGTNPQVGSIPSAAGGDGKHVTGSLRIRIGPGGVFINEDLCARFIPGEADILQTLSILNRGYIGSFCFKRSGKIDEDSTGGAFACVAFGTDKSGGVYIADPGGSFTKKHSGTAIDLDTFRWRGAVAVGKLGFIG